MEEKVKSESVRITKEKLKSETEFNTWTAQDCKTMRIYVNDSVRFWGKTLLEEYLTERKDRFVGPYKEIF